jgi:phosphonate transport system ATP-binding protein
MRARTGPASGTSPAKDKPAAFDQPEDLAVMIDGVSRTFGGTVKALDKVSLQVRKGEFCVILGPSGSGKTTLLRAINGLTEIDAGRIEVSGMLVARKHLATVRKRIGMVHQHFGLIDQFTVAENILAGAATELGWGHLLLRRFPKRLTAAACDLMERVGLDAQQANRRARDLSGGQRQRVGIARALILDPEIILADEPVASLDPRIAADVMTLIKTMSRERNVAVLCSLHQVDLALAFADRIIAMRNGRVVFDGPANALDAKTIASIYHDLVLHEGGQDSAKPRTASVG